MELEKIINVFTKRDKDNNPLIVKILDTIKDFDRRMDLKAAFRELKQIYEDYDEERVKFVKKLIKSYCNEMNEKNSDKPDWDDLDPDNIQRIPNIKAEEYNNEIEKRNKKNITLKDPLMFYKDEIQRAKLVFSEEELLDGFVFWDKNKPTKKKDKK